MGEKHISICVIDSNNNNVLLCHICDLSVYWLDSKRASAEKSRGKGQRKKQDRKIAPLSLPYFISIMYENPGGRCPPVPLFRRPWLDCQTILSES